jgi:hypothetical protein
MRDVQHVAQMGSGLANCLHNERKVRPVRMLTSLFREDLQFVAALGFKTRKAGLLSLLSLQHLFPWENKAVAYLMALRQRVVMLDQIFEYRVKTALALITLILGSVFFVFPYFNAPAPSLDRYLAGNDAPVRIIFLTQTEGKLISEPKNGRRVELPLTYAYDPAGHYSMKLGHNLLFIGTSSSSRGFLMCPKCAEISMNDKSLPKLSTSWTVRELEH